MSGRDKSTIYIYNSLKKYYKIENVIIEKHPPLIRYFRRRIKSLGLINVVGQILFLGIIVPFLKIIGHKRILEIKNQNNFSNEKIESNKISHVNSVNSLETIKIIKKINPDLILVNGTRIISEKVLNCVSARFINMHMGITPLYRGLHGGYWALANLDKVRCGVTIHYIDEGIDTGKILEQCLISINKKDNFITYPLLQLAVGIPLLKDALYNLTSNKILIKAYPDGDSKFWSHPTFWVYLLNFIKYGIK